MNKSLSRPRWAPPVGVGAALPQIDFDPLGLAESFGGAIQAYAPIAFPGSPGQESEEEQTLTPMFPLGETQVSGAGLQGLGGMPANTGGIALPSSVPLGAGPSAIGPAPSSAGGIGSGYDDMPNTRYHTDRQSQIDAGIIATPPLANDDEGDLTSGWEQFGNPALASMLLEQGLNAADVVALCGPIAAAGALRAFGITDIEINGERLPMTPATLARDAADRGEWGSAGMALGDGTSMSQLMARHGVGNQNLPASQQAAQQMQALVEKGVPVVLNFPQHYMLAQDYDPETDRWFVGSTGSNALSGGGDWMTLEEMGRHPGNGGPIQTFIAPQNVPEGAVEAYSKKRFSNVAGEEPQDVLPDTRSRDTVVQSVEPLARYWEGKTNIPAEVFLAFNLHEGGSQVMDAPFGIKGSGTAGTQSQQTWEQTAGGVWQGEQEFAAYNNLNEAYDGFIKLVSNPQGRYAGAWGYLQDTGDWRGWLRQINRAGYATDPVWGDKIAAFAENEILPRMGPDPQPPAEAQYGDPPAVRGNAPAPSAGRGPGMASPPPSRPVAAEPDATPSAPAAAPSRSSTFGGVTATTRATVQAPTPTPVAQPNVIQQAEQVVTGAVNDVAATVTGAANDVYTAVDDFLGGLW